MSAVITCPSWCESEHIRESSHPDDRPIHNKQFGDPEGASVEVWVELDATGHVKETGFLFNIVEAEDPEDMDEVAGWCAAAAEFMRQIRSAEAAFLA